METKNDHVLGIGRYYKGEKLLAFFNFSEFEQTIWPNEEEGYTDLISGKKTKAQSIKMEGHSFRWLFHDYSTTNKG